jgi:hypothetical protein
MVVDLAAYVLTHTTHPVWGKLPAIFEAFDTYPNAEWIWWLDSDAIIMDVHLDLYNILLDPKVMSSQLRIGDPILVPTDDVPFDSGLRTGEVPTTPPSHNTDVIIDSQPPKNRLNSLPRPPRSKRRFNVLSKHPHHAYDNRPLVRPPNSRKRTLVAPSRTRCSNILDPKPSDSPRANRFRKSESH